MDSEKKHQIIKEAFSSETLLNLKTIIDDVYEGLTFEEKNNFLIHLEFEFLVNIKKEIKSTKANIGLFRLTGRYDEVVSFENKKKQHYKFLRSWVEQKKSNNLKVELSEINASENKAKANYLGQPANDEAINFFKFLCENYRPEDSTQVKYVNILYFLKHNADKKHFIFNLKQDGYKKMVIKNTGIIISKFEKSATYEESDKPIFHSLENTFLKMMKL